MSDKLPAPVLAQVARPGDTLLLTFAERLSAADGDRLLRHIKDKLPEGIHLGIVDGCTGAVICRPDSDSP
jgi:hypothetical protein